MKARHTPRRVITGLLVRLRIVTEQGRAQRLRMMYPNVTVHRQARLGRGARVHVAPGGILRLGCGAIADGVTLTVGSAGRLVMDGKYLGPHSVIVARDSVTVQAGAMIAEMCVVRDSDHLREPDGRISDDKYASAAVTIGRDTWLGSHVTVLKGVSVGDGATVGAGAVVTRSVRAGQVVAGVPAKATGSGRDDRLPAAAAVPGHRLA